MKTLKGFVMQILLLSLFLVSACGDDGDNDSSKQYRYESTLNSDGIVRTYIVNLPLQYYDDAATYPLVMALHGGGGSASHMESNYGLTEKAVGAGFIVVYPEGVQSDGPLGARSWNAGTCCGYAGDNDINDVKFIGALIDELKKTWRVDPKKIYVTGMSNGGMMAYRLACELSDKITAIAPVAASMMKEEPCNPVRPVPVLHVHSILDENVPYDGGLGVSGDFYAPPLDSVLTVWSINNGCGDDPVVQDNEEFVKTTWDNCGDQSAIEYYLTYDGGHSWPGGKPRALADPPSEYINANDLMLDFFQRFALP